MPVEFTFGRNNKALLPSFRNEEVPARCTVHRIHCDEQAHYPYGSSVNTIFVFFGNRGGRSVPLFSDH